MYWMTILLQSQAPNYELLSIIIGLVIGLLPGFLTAWAARRKWYGGEQEVTLSVADMNQAKAIESITTAAGLIASQSQALSDKSATLVSLLEEEVTRQQRIIDEERAFSTSLKSQHEREIQELKEEIKRINYRIEVCSTQLKLLIKDLRDGIAITVERLDAVENTMV